MKSSDPRVDAYIENAAEFAQPILRHFRQLVHAVCPEVEETIKWKMPFFDHHGLLCHVAAFKAHCTIGFWHQQVQAEIERDLGQDESAAGHLGRITQLGDLPSDARLRGYLKKALALNEAGEPARPREPAKAKTELVVPPAFASALKKNKAAATAFAELSYSHRKEYIEWITEAKRDETRDKRITTALAWIAEGKSRNWKYE